VPIAKHLPAGVMTEQEAKGEEHSSPGGVGPFTGHRPLPLPSVPITVLCAARSTVYRSFTGLAIYTRSANALNANPPGPVIAHPPCRCWSRSWARSNLTPADRITEMLLAFHCLRLVITHGGVLEHPAHSRLWPSANLPRPGDLTQAPALWSIAVDQANWGHRAAKPTWLLFAHVEPLDVTIDHWALASPSVSHLSALTPGQRSATPPLFAAFLVALARSAKPPRSAFPFPWETPHHPASPTPEKPHSAPARPQSRD